MTSAVSIHAPREGCDPQVFFDLYRINRFQFTHPGRGATKEGWGWVILTEVSIHAPREGCDPFRLRQ